MVTVEIREEVMISVVGKNPSSGALKNLQQQQDEIFIYFLWL